MNKNLNRALLAGAISIGINYFSQLPRSIGQETNTQIAKVLQIQESDAERELKESYLAESGGLYVNNSLEAKEYRSLYNDKKEAEFILSFDRASAEEDRLEISRHRQSWGK
ncbi:hypothetical protein COB57_03905 [Candidatus Peregrinibacteria bacterium]|nr:MAG: hypothetical protein COB57_03905 [Candidatus Peregrinibacteria bacterium]